MSCLSWDICNTATFLPIAFFVMNVPKNKFWKVGLPFIIFMDIVWRIVFNIVWRWF